MENINLVVFSLILSLIALFFALYQTDFEGLKEDIELISKSVENLKIEVENSIKKSIYIKWVVENFNKFLKYIQK